MNDFAFPSPPGGRSYKILARGDCTSRRTLALNPGMFEKKPAFVQCQKSPFVLFTDAAVGKSVSVEYLRSISDVQSMPPMLRDYYIGQADRAILEADDADLLMLDSYADMNFELWENQDGIKFWIHPKHLFDLAGFRESHRKLGRRTLQESVDDAVRLIETIRIKNPGLPVLFLNQQTDYYPKLDERVDEYYRLGELVADRLPGVFYGGVVPKEALELADVGSCGPGLTLHFQGDTYRRMVDRALDVGLRDALIRRFESQPGAVVRPHEVNTAVNASAMGEVEEHPKVTISLRVNSPTCVPACAGIWDASVKSLSRYLAFPGTGEDGDLKRQFTPMLIPFSEIASMESWEAHIKTFGKGARIRQKKKAIAAGYYVKMFRWHMHIPDIHAANNSMPIRSGGTIRANLTKTIEEMGGAPEKLLPVVLPKCKCHWQIPFGVFRKKPGHMQGSVVVDEELVGYITPKRIGDVVIYTQILGHGDHLPNGILTLLHHEVIKWLLANSLDDGYADGLKYVMYGGLENGANSELPRFKRQAGFSPHLVRAEP